MNKSVRMGWENTWHECQG